MDEHCITTDGQTFFSKFSGKLTAQLLQMLR